MSDDNERAQRILDAAERLIVHYGYNKTTVSEIAQEAGVSKGAIYLHWESKDQLFTALLAREVNRTIEHMVNNIETDPAGGTVSGFVQAMLRAVNGNRLIQALYAQDHRILGKYLQQIDTNIFTYRFNAYAEALPQMCKAGLIRDDLNLRIVSYILSAISYGMFNMPLDMPASAEEVIEQIGILMELALAPTDTAGDSEVGKRILKKAIFGMKIRLNP